MDPDQRLSRPHYRKFVALVAQQHQCRLVDIDFCAGIIELSGEEQAVYSCGRELKKLLGQARQRVPEA